MLKHKVLTSLLRWVSPACPKCFGSSVPGHLVAKSGKWLNQNCIKVYVMPTYI